MSIPRDEVERIAALARLEIPPERLDRVADELSRVIAFVAALDRLDLTGCEPTVLGPVAATAREDAIGGDRLSAAQATAMAPAAEDGFFLVPPIVENVNP